MDEIGNDAEFSQGNNLYWYVENNPVSKNDSYGLNGLVDDTVACTAGVIANLEGIVKGDLPQSLLPRYGNFCGPGYGVSLDRASGKPDPTGTVFGSNPIDEIDACCQAHDLAYRP